MKTGRLCLTVFTNVVLQVFWHHLQHNSTYKKAMLLLNVLCYLATTDKGSDISGKIGSSCVIPIFFFILAGDWVWSLHHLNITVKKEADL